MKKQYWPLLVLTVLFGGCGEADVSKPTSIVQSDYDSYPQYWFDKASSEVGTTSVQVPETVFDFDVMPPNFLSSHRFKIRNTGNQPLRLLVGPKTCKCTALKLIDREIAPQAVGEVEVGWKTVSVGDTFRHWATVYTNDPNQREIQFTVQGKIANEFGMYPGEVRFDRVQPDTEQLSREVLFFSEEWEDLEVSSVSCSWGNSFQFEEVPIRSQQRETVKFRSAKNLRFQFSPPPESGRFQGEIHVTLKGGGKTVQQMIPLAGKIIRRISVESIKDDMLSPQGLLTLGRVERQQGRTETLLVTVNDPEKTLAIRSMTSDPGYVSATLTPLNSKVSQHGVYRLTIEIPAGQMPELFNRQGDWGNLKIEFDHPRVAPLELKLDFYVID